MPYYWSYGSNLNIAQMKRRCPRAKIVGPMELNDAALVFRGVADVVIRRGSTCPGGLWEITPACEAVLDIYEGVDSGLYEKRYLLIKVGGRKRDCLFYKMLQRGIMPPSEGYLAGIAQGYTDFGLDLTHLDAAVEHSWNRRNKTPELRARHARRGSPSLARALFPLA